MAIVIKLLAFKLYGIATMAGKKNDLRSRLSPIFEIFYRPLLRFQIVFVWALSHIMLPFF